VDYVNLGRTGLKVSRICLGCLGFGSPAWMPWILDEAASRPILARAVEAGINFFDTADMYSLGEGEAVVGRVLADLAPRDELVIASKVFFAQSDDPNDRGLSRKHIMRAVDRSLKALGTDYIDLYQIHRFDFYTPIEETLEALHDVVKAGKARYIGASTMKAWQFAKMLHVAERNGWTRPVSMQPHYSLIQREEEREMLPLCLDAGVAVNPWGPLAGGFLTGRYTREQRAGSARDQHNLQVGRGGYGEADYAVAEAVSAVAAERGVKPAVVALAWMLAQPAVTAPVVGANRVAYLDDALAAIPVRLLQEEIARLEAPYRAKPSSGATRAEVDLAVAKHQETVPARVRTTEAAR
jgi:aryl-alcohol dehydrogenase-like predicted oxidoreductase